MSQQTIAGPLGDIRILGASKGVSLSATAARTFIPRGTRWMSLTARNFSTAVVAQYAFNPWLVVLKTTDDLVLESNLTDYSEQAQDNDAATDVTLSSLGTAAQGDYLLVGSHMPFEGVYADVDSANGNASVLTINYWNGSAWTDTSNTDGTDSGGASMAVDGANTWTVPSAWVMASIYDIQTALDGNTNSTAQNVGLFRRELYWTQWAFSAALDSSTTLNSMLAIRRASANYAELIENQTIEQSIQSGPGGFVSFDALTDAGTGNMVATIAGRFRPGD